MNDAINEAFEKVDDILGNCQALTYNAIRKNEFSSIELICCIKDARKAMVEFENTLRAERDRIREKEERQTDEYDIMIEYARAIIPNPDLDSFMNYISDGTKIGLNRHTEGFAKGWFKCKEHYKIS